MSTLSKSKEMINGEYFTVFRNSHGVIVKKKKIMTGQSRPLVSTPGNSQITDYFGATAQTRYEMTNNQPIVNPVVQNDYSTELISDGITMDEFSHSEPLIEEEPEQTEDAVHVREELLEGHPSYNNSIQSKEISSSTIELDEILISEEDMVTSLDEDYEYQNDEINLNENCSDEVSTMDPKQHGLEEYREEYESKKKQMVSTLKEEEVKLSVPDDNYEEVETEEDAGMEFSHNVYDLIHNVRMSKTNGYGFTLKTIGDSDDTLAPFNFSDIQSIRAYLYKLDGYRQNNPALFSMVRPQLNNVLDCWIKGTARTVFPELQADVQADDFLVSLAEGLENFTTDEKGCNAVDTLGYALSTAFAIVTDEEVDKSYIATLYGTVYTGKILSDNGQVTEYVSDSIAKLLSRAVDDTVSICEELAVFNPLYVNNFLLTNNFIAVSDTDYRILKLVGSEIEVMSDM